MIKLKEETGKLWSMETVFSPYLLDYIHGDGKQVIWFEYMNDRPRYYVIRVDSKMVFTMGEITDENEPVLQEIMSAISDEAEEFMTEEQYDCYRFQGWWDEDKGDREWPIPPFEMPDGFQFGRFRDNEMLEQVRSLNV